MEKAFYESGSVLKRPVSVFSAAIFLTAGVLLLLPLTQHIAKKMDGGMEVRNIEVSLPPPPPPPPEPPPPEEPEQEQPEPKLDQPPQQLSLSQLELSLNPGAGNAFGATFGLGGFEIDADAMGELATFSIGELDEAPRMLRNPAWALPRHARGKVPDETTLKVDIFINPDGRVQVHRMIVISDPIIERDVIEFVERIRFSSPKRDGKPVRAKYRLPLTLEHK